jgi:hypothetical protein
MDALGRRPLLLAGSLGMTISHITIAILVSRFDNDWPAHRREGWTGVVFLLVYMICFGASWGPVNAVRNLPIVTSGKRCPSVNLQ